MDPVTTINTLPDWPENHQRAVAEALDAIPTGDWLDTANAGFRALSAVLVADGQPAPEETSVYEEILHMVGYRSAYGACEAIARHLGRDPKEFLWLLDD
jgi:tellurite resistance protein